MFFRTARSTWQHVRLRCLWVPRRSQQCHSSASYTSCCHGMDNFNVYTAFLTFAALELQSRGPVGFSDALDQTNVSLIKRTCTANGSLLQPRKPLTTIDRLLFGDDIDGKAPTVLTSFEGTLPMPGASSATNNSFPTVVYTWYVVSFGTWGHGLPSVPFQVQQNDLWPPLDLSLSEIFSGRLARWQWGAGHCVNGTASSDCATLFSSSPSTSVVVLPPPPQDTPLTAVLHTVTPQCSSGWTLLGELGKFATLSGTRFVALDHSGQICSKMGLKFAVHGSPAEDVEITLLTPDNTVLVREIVIPSSGRVELAFP